MKRKLDLSKLIFEIFDSCVKKPLMKKHFKNWWINTRRYWFNNNSKHWQLKRLPQMPLQLTVRHHRNQMRRLLQQRG